MGPELCANSLQLPDSSSAVRFDKVSYTDGNNPFAGITKLLNGFGIKMVIVTTTKTCQHNA